LSTTLEIELGRYDAVIHLRTPAQEHGYNHQNEVTSFGVMVALAALLGLYHGVRASDAAV